jgi:hypothetical protein
LNQSDATSRVLYRLAAEYIAHRAMTVRASFGLGYEPPPWTFVPARDEVAAFEELRHIRYICRLAGRWAITEAGEAALLRGLVPAPPTRSGLAVLESVGQYDTERRIRSVDYQQWMSALRLQKKIDNKRIIDASNVIASLNAWYLDRIIGATAFYKVAKWGWVALRPGKARTLVHDLVELFWQRYDQDIFDIRYTWDELLERGAASRDDDPYMAEELIAGLGLGHGNSEKGWSLPEPELARFVALGCTSGDDFLEKRRVIEAADKKIVDAANTSEMPPMALDLAPIWLWREVVERTRAEPWSTPRPDYTPEAIWRTVRLLVEQFRHMVEDRNMWRLLWNNATPRPESSSQELFEAIASSYCRANNLDITPEADTGRGWVDFKFSAGFSARLLVELKLSSNTRLVHGYETQLQLYKLAEETTNALYLIVDVGGMDQKKLNKIHDLRRAALDRGDAASEIVIVNATRKESGSVADDLGDGGHGT